MLIGTERGLLQVQPINENAGYLEIKLKEVEVTNQTDTVVHVINPNEINQILDQISTNIENFDIQNRNFLKLEIDTIRTKVRTIIPSSIRKKRGLINAVGTVYKWLFGTMDDDDRNEILEYLKTTEENSHNAITTINKQVKINTYFNDSMTKLRDAIEDDREEIREAFKEVKTTNNEIIKRFLFIDQLTKLRNLENKVDQIQDNIVAAKQNIIHPSIFTSKEILKYDIDFYKLKLLKVGIMNYKENSLIIAIQIPQSYIVTDLKLITPLPNENFLEIDEHDHYVIKINNQVLEYKDNTLIRHLKRSRSCILTKKCTFRYNNKTEIKDIDEDTLLVKNANKEKLYQNCDNRNLVIMKNYLVVFNNCKVTIANESFVNHKEFIEEKYFYPSNKEISNISKTLSFNSIANQYFTNIEEIKEIKYHKNISYGINVMFIIILIVIIYTLFRLKRKTNVKIVNNIKEDKTDDIELNEIIKKYKNNKIQENL